MNKIFYIILFFFAISCSTKKSIVKEINKEITKDSLVDSISKKEKEKVFIKESTIIEKKDSVVKIKVPIEKNSYFGNDSSYLENSYSKSWAWIVNGKLKHILINKDSIQSKVTIIRNSSINNKSKEKENKEEKTKIKYQYKYIYKDKYVYKNKTFSFFSQCKIFISGFIVGIVFFILFKYSRKIFNKILPFINRF